MASSSSDGLVLDGALEGEIARLVERLGRVDPGCRVDLHGLGDRVELALGVLAVDPLLGRREVLEAGILEYRLGIAFER